MKKIVLLLIAFALIGCSTQNIEPTVAPKISIVEPSDMFNFGLSWLYEYDPSSYNLEIYPYTVGSGDLDDMRALWDLDSNGSVNIFDFALFAKLDMATMVADMEVLKKHPLTEESIETWALGIYHKEKDFGIADFKLFKLLLQQSDFDVFVTSYTLDNEIYAILSWESDLQTGWIDIHLWRHEYLYGRGFKYTYKYLVENKI